MSTVSSWLEIHALRCEGRHGAYQDEQDRPTRFLVDVAVRLREPGLEYKATLQSELHAAVAGGVTSLACLPDTDPPLDEPGLVEMLKHRARLLNLAHVYPLGALTAQLAGERLTEMAELTDAGCVGFSMPTRRCSIPKCSIAPCSTQPPSGSRSGCGLRSRSCPRTG